MLSLSFMARPELLEPAIKKDALGEFTSHVYLLSASVCPIADCAIFLSFPGLFSTSAIILIAYILII